MKTIFRHKFTAYLLVVITAFSLLCAVYLFGDNRMLSMELTEINRSYSRLQENLNQTQLALNNASDRLIEVYERIEEQSEERAGIIQAILQYHDYWIEYWEDVGVQPGDLAVKAHISPLYSFVMVYPESLVPDEYAEAILRICRQAKREISRAFGLEKRFLNRRILVCMFPREEDARLGVDWKNDVIIMTLRTQDLTEYTKNHIYGFIHEVAHLFAYLGDEFHQGWATYASARVFWDVVEGLGNDVWPMRVNVTEDIQKVWQVIEAGEDPYIKAPRVLFEIDSLYGPGIIGDALKRLPATREEPIVTWPELRHAIIDVTGEPEIITAIFVEEGFT